MQCLIRTLSHRYEMFQAPDGAQSVLLDWCNRSSYANGKTVSVANVGDTFTGVTRGLEGDGALRVETDAGELRIVRAGDVTSLRSAS